MDRLLHIPPGALDSLRRMLYSFGRSTLVATAFCPAHICGRNYDFEFRQLKPRNVFHKEAVRQTKGVDKKVLTHTWKKGRTSTTTPQCPRRLSGSN